jgi:hypothetical protein
MYASKLDRIETTKFWRIFKYSSDDGLGVDMNDCQRETFENNYYKYRPAI